MFWVQMMRLKIQFMKLLPNFLFLIRLINLFVIRFNKWILLMKWRNFLILLKFNHINDLALWLVNFFVMIFFELLFVRIHLWLFMIGCLSIRAFYDFFISFDSFIFHTLDPLLFMRLIMHVLLLLQIFHLWRLNVLRYWLLKWNLLCKLILMRERLVWQGFRLVRDTHLILALSALMLFF